MRVIADENMPFVREAFGHFGEIVTCTGRDMDNATLSHAEVLLVRSVTKVTAELLEGTPVHFVASATTGTDHVDLEYLAARGIGFAHAPGSNAESVAQYLVAALLVMAERMGTDLRSKSIGIVGVGNVGSRVARNARALGMDVLLNDPPLQRQTGDPSYLPMEALLDADFLTLHVPLTHTGPDATFHMVDENLLARLKPGTVLINTARGAAVETLAVLQALKSGRLSGAVLDVWEQEPAVSPDLLEIANIGTPHIAGYSFDGKVRGTSMIYQAACECLGIMPEWNVADCLPPPEIPSVDVSATAQTDSQVILSEVVRTVYDIEADDAALRASLSLPESERAAHFDRTRKHYPRRREFLNTKITLGREQQHLADLFRTLQFQVAEPD